MGFSTAYIIDLVRSFLALIIRLETFKAKIRKIHVNWDELVTLCLTRTFLQLTAGGL